VNRKLNETSGLPSFLNNIVGEAEPTQIANYGYYKLVTINEAYKMR